MQNMHKSTHDRPLTGVHWPIQIKCLHASLGHSLWSGKPEKSEVRNLESRPTEGPFLQGPNPVESILCNLGGLVGKMKDRSMT